MSDQQKIQFLEYQKPALASGSYKITVKQNLDTPDQEVEIPATEVDFAVLGERFSLDPTGIHAMYPPAGSLGRYTDCLPHIAIKRSTFPWERSAYGQEDDEPWLALLLFDEKEINDGEVKPLTGITLKDLITKNSDAKFRDIALEIGQSEADKIKAIDVKKSLLEKVMPSGDELKLLAHVRKKVDGDQYAPETELAVVVANRLPKEGSGSTMHLVSVEGRYNSDTTVDYQGATADDYIRLVSLKSWSFSSLTEEGKNFEELVEDLSTDVLRISVEQTNAAHSYLSRGYVPLPHTLRQSDKTYSWYHGPLSTHHVPAIFNNDNDLPVFADTLTRYHQDISMFDTSYAAAFELGRTLTLENALASAALYQWKSRYNEKVCLELQHTEATHLRGANENSHTGEENKLEQPIKTWFDQLTLLHEVPFNYLVPDEKMLPAESIRFFKIDQHWIECLLYGAFTIGGNIRKKTEEDHSRFNHFKRLTDLSAMPNKSGFILRSRLVADYPDLMVDAYSARVDHASPLSTTDKGAKLQNLRGERLGADVLLCLYEGNVSTVELYLKPEGLRMGLDEEEAGFSKDIYNPGQTTIPLPNLLKDADKRVIKIKDEQQEGIADQIEKKLQEGITDQIEQEKSIDSARFGMHMIEGSNKGRFVIRNH